MKSQIKKIMVNILNSTPRMVVCVQTEEDCFYFPNGSKLTVGERYNMIGIKAFAFHTHVFLTEFPNLPFNSVQLGEIGED